LPDPEIEVAQRAFELGAVGDFVRDDAEFRAHRIGQLTAHHRDRDRNRMARAQGAHDDVERVGELRAERLLPPRALHVENEERHHEQAKQAEASAVEDVAVEEIHRARRDHRAGDHDQDELGEADRHAGLQDELVEGVERQPVVAAAGQAALAAQLHEDALAVGLILQHAEAAIDPAAIARAGEKEQVQRFHKHDRRCGGEEVEDMNLADLESHHALTTAGWGRNSCPGS
jgi:hypothetical protein